MATLVYGLRPVDGGDQDVEKLRRNETPVRNYALVIQPFTARKPKLPNEATELITIGRRAPVIFQLHEGGATLT